MISQEKLKILTPLQKLPKNVEDLGKLIIAKGLKKLPKVKKIAQSGLTDSVFHYYATLILFKVVGKQGSKFSCLVH